MRADILHKMSKFAVLLLISNALTQSVYWEPEIPTPGGDITVFYNVIEGTLDDNTNPVYIHIGYNGWVDVDDYVMINQGAGWWSYTYSIPIDAETVDFVFTDLLENWDASCQQVGTVVDGMKADGTYVLPEGGIDFAEIRDAIDAVLHRIPRYRQKLHWIPFDRHAVWVDDLRFSLDFHLLGVDQGRFDARLERIRILLLTSRDL